MTTDNLKLPYIMAAQAQKHVTHNEALRQLDVLVQLAVTDRDRTLPPTPASPGVRHIVAAAATGAWSGRDGQIAAFQDGAWAFYAPQPGFLAFVRDEACLLVFDGAGWVPLEAVIETLPFLGVNTTADATNRLSVTAAATLFNQEGGSHRMAINKAAAADTASILFQTGFSGRAELGLTGDDAWHVKVSPDGQQWREALAIDAASGHVGLGTPTPASPLHVAGPAPALTLEDTDAPDINGRWHIASYHHAGDNSLRLTSAGAGFGTGGVIAEFRKSASGQPTVGLNGVARSDALLSTYGNLSAAHGIRVQATNLSPSSTAAIFASATVADGQRLFAGAGNEVEVFRVEGDGTSYFAGEMGIGVQTPTARLHVGAAMRLEPYATPADLPAAAVIGAGGIACAYTGSDLKLMICDGSQWSEL